MCAIYPFLNPSRHNRNFCFISYCEYLVWCSVMWRVILMRMKGNANADLWTDEMFLHSHHWFMHDVYVCTASCIFNTKKSIKSLRQPVQVLSVPKLVKTIPIDSRERCNSLVANLATRQQRNILAIACTLRDELGTMLQCNPSAHIPYLSPWRLNNIIFVYAINHL